MNPIRSLIPDELPPQVADDVAAIVAKAIRMALASHKPTDPAVWQRAFIAASSEFASEELAGKWRQS